MVNKVRVNIAGTPYAIATTDSEKYIQSLAKKLDEDITKLLDENENLSVTKAAVFCAMDYLDEYRKSTGSAENMRSQIQDYIADAARAKLAEDKAKAENEVLRREAAALREQLAKERRRESRRACRRTGCRRRKTELNTTLYKWNGELCRRLRSLPLWAVKKCCVPPCSAGRMRSTWAFRASMPAPEPAILTPTA